MSRWIALKCGEETDELQARHPNAFLLLCQIARRAKWKDCSITKLKAGQSFIGDWIEAGLPSEKAYRHAKQILAECGLATFRGANKGTVATLENSMIFSITTEQGGEQGGGQGADKGRTRGGQGATNHTDTQIHRTPIVATNGTSPDSPQKIAWSVDGGFSGITDKDHHEWQEAFPAVDIPQQLAASSRWLKDNPAKRKKQVGRFLTNWFSKNQERGGSVPSNPPSSSPPPAGCVVAAGRTFKLTP